VGSEKADERGESMYRNKYMMERLKRLDEAALKQRKRSTEEAYAQYDRQNSVDSTKPKESEEN